MIETKKVDLYFSYISYFLRTAANVVLLPIILSKLSSDEYGLWNVYISIGAFVNLIDAGFGIVMRRYLTYSYCGMENIPDDGNIEKMKMNSKPNFKLLFRIFYASKRLYFRLSIYAMIIVLLISVYVLKIRNTVSMEMVLVSWGIYGLSVVLSIYYIVYGSILKALGKNKESSIFVIVQYAVYLSLSILLLLSDMGIIGVAVANFVSTFLYRSLCIGFINKFFAEQKEIRNEIKKEEKSEQNRIYDLIKKNSQGLGLISISNYVVSYGSTLICSIFLPLKTIASLGLTNQMIGVVSSVATTPSSVFMPKLSDITLHGDKEKLKNWYSIIFILLFVVYLVGGVCLLLLGDYVLELINSQTSLLSMPIVIIMLITSYLQSNHQRCTGFIMIFNKQPHVKAYIVSSILTMVLSGVCLRISRNICSYVVVALIVQCSYNAWKWPYEANKYVEINVGEMWHRGFMVLKNKFISIDERSN
jgi:O-antigen/teichoic acid export membrane protein